MDSWEDRLICIKLLRRVSDRDLRRVKRAFDLHAPIEHPNVVRLLDLIEDDDGSPGVVMEWIDGVDLERFWLGLPTSRQMTGGERWRWLRPMVVHLLDAIQELHGRGVLHRDLKPQNVMVRPDWQPVVIDLGLARTVGDNVELTPRDQVVGTPLYIPPEVLRRGQHVEASDFHSIGVMMYQLVVGRPPFVGSSLPDLMNSILTRAVPPLALECPDLPPRVAALIDRLLAKLPEDRPQTTDEIRVALRLPSSGPIVPTLVPLQSEPPLVGRGGDLAWFRQTLDRWQSAGGAEVIGLVGAPGIGKSRLLRAFADLARKRAQLDVELTVCLPRAPRIALAPLLRHMTEVDVGSPTSLGERVQKHSSRPLVYLVDDADAADLQTRSGLRDFVTGAVDVGARPVLVVLVSATDGVARSVVGPVCPASSRLVDRLPRARLVELFVPDQRRRVDETHVLDELERYSEGHPDRVRAWLLEETMAGRLTRAHVRWSVTITGSEGFGPPVFLQVTRPERICGWLQCLGGSVPLEMLLGVAPCDPAPLLAGLLAAKRAGLAAFRAVGNWAWVDVLREPAHAIVPDLEEAAELHDLTARWLTLHAPGAGLADEWIAEHWLKAGERRRAIAALRRAASENASLGLESDALRLLRLATRHERKLARETADRSRSDTVTDLFERRDLLRSERLRSSPTDRFRWSTTG